MNLTDLLQRTFGFSSFRANQEAVCRAASEGKDVLLVMPTGAGKSLCYQLPAIARGGTALVISPLIALMDDQAAKLAAAGLRVARIHSGLDREQSRQACREYLDGTLQFLFIAPERLRVPGFPEMLAKRKPALIAIDEAHCISAWGHDFRPDYRTLGEHLPALRPAPVIALTATATPAVQQDIVMQLGLQQPERFIHGFRRHNLAIELVELSKPRRGQFTVDLLKDPAARPAIVYAPSRKAAEELATLIGRSAAPYHAGLDPATRERVQRHFLAGNLEVVVATIAFGMGIDKADVRTVIHTALPASVEAYYQEIGRAGRDGLPSRTILLHSFADRKMHDFFLERDYPAATQLAAVARALTAEFQEPAALAQALRLDQETLDRTLLKLVAVGAAVMDIAGNIRAGAAGNWRASYDQQLNFRRSQIDRMIAFAETPQCRMAALVQHFGDTADGLRPCGLCDFCSPERATASPFRAPTSHEDRQLRAILRELDGSQPRSTGKLHTDLGLGVDRKQFDAYLDALARAGLITLTQDTFTNAEGREINFRRAALTYEGRTRTDGEPLAVLLRDEGTSPSPGKRSRSGSSSAAKPGGRPTRAAATEDVTLTPAQAALAEQLREWRKQEAARTRKPAFLVFSDSTLTALALHQPTSLRALQQVPGIGQEKADRYGAEVIALCSGASTPAPAAKKPKQVAQAKQPQPRPAKAKGAVTSPALARPVAVPAPARPQHADPAATLTPAQQQLDLRLRAWRKSEAEKLGLPQFFVFGSSALRSIVLKHPRTVTQLRAISGMDPEKLDRYAEGILEVCNS
ncbi:MAG: RecQ family ATP-dependent DNA helicase [Acidobacteriota bacterium]|nr:RecQ family ATP-dependent DNA helicase [Acidobacteriota bacterium]